MRIALVITELDPGGAELCLTELALFLRLRGHEVGVWALGPPPRAHQTSLLDRLIGAGIAVQFGHARGGRDAWRSARWLRCQLDAFAPDIVQSMLWHANIITAWAVWQRKWPWFGGMRVSEPRSGRWWLERIAARRMQRLICVSQDVQRHAVQAERIAPQLIRVIPNGVASGLIDAVDVPIRSPLESLREQPTLLFVGRLEAQKGVRGLAAHLPTLLGDHPQWHLVIVGQGSLEPLLRQQAQLAGLTPRTHLVGWQANVPTWMQASQLLVLPTLYEGMPNVLLEAMALARPFVAFAVDGVQELMAADAGFPTELAMAQTAPPNDWPTFLARTHELLRNTELRMRCGQANRQHVARHFRLEDQLAKYEQEYKRAVNQTD